MDVTREFHFHITRSEFSATVDPSVDHETQDLVRVICKPFCRSIIYYGSTAFGCLAALSYQWIIGPARPKYHLSRRLSEFLDPNVGSLISYDPLRLVVVR